MTDQIALTLDRLQAELATLIEDYVGLQRRLEVAEREKAALRRDLEALLCRRSTK